MPKLKENSIKEKVKLLLRVNVKQSSLLNFQILTPACAIQPQWKGHLRTSMVKHIA